MSDFDTDISTSTVTDLSKRVRYSTGLVLGVDEFEQDQAYLIARDRLLTRALHGYGVVQGLDVALDDPQNELPQVKVRPGVAVTPDGQHVCVERTQCAVLDDWLARQDPDTLLEGEEDGGGTEICVFVVLRYGTRATDFVPIPGGPCRTEEESRAASRLADDFTLTLELDDQRPQQVEEHAIRLLGKLMRALVVKPTPPYVDASTVTTLVEAVPAVLTPGESAENGPTVADAPTLGRLAEQADLDVESDEHAVHRGPGGDEDLIFPVEPGTEAKMLRSILDPWVTTVRREVLWTGHDPDNSLETGRCGRGRCQPVPRGDDGVVLARLCLSVQSNGSGTVQPATDDGRVNVDDVTLTTDERPQLLSSRVLQETGLFNHVRPGEGDDVDDSLDAEDAGGDLSGTYPEPTVVGLDETPIADLQEHTPGADDVLGWRGEEWRPIAIDTLEGEEVEGDVAGTYGDPLRVRGLQTTPVIDLQEQSPAKGDVLAWRQGEAGEEAWRPVSLQDMMPEPEPTPESERVPSNAERGLTRIVATSWAHQRTYTDREKMFLGITRQGERFVRPGLAVAFGTKPLQDETTLDREAPGLVEAQTLTPEVFRVFFERKGAEHLYSRVRVAPEAIVGLETVQVAEVDGDLQIVEGVVGQSEKVRGAVFLLPELGEQIDQDTIRFEVELRGDFILDTKERAIDAEFVRGELPTGDRPSRAERRDETIGVQGGRFESWFQYQEMEAPEVILNQADVDELTILPGVGRVIAERILEYREGLEEGEQIERLEQLGENVSGVGEDALRRLRDWEGRIRF